MTSIFDLYQVPSLVIRRMGEAPNAFQFFLRLADTDVERYLKLFTLCHSRKSRRLWLSIQRAVEAACTARISSRLCRDDTWCTEAKDAEARHRLFWKPFERKGLSSGNWAINNSLNKLAPQTNSYNVPPVNLTLPASRLPTIHCACSFRLV
jgi:hypothetical protein